MFHAPMGRFQLELFIFIAYFPTTQARRQKKIQRPTRPVENVALTTKSLQKRKTQLLNGTTVEK